MLDYLEKADMHTLWQVIRYGLAGATGVVIQASFLYFFVEYGGFWYLHSVVLAFLITLGIVFSLQKLWTFRDYSTDTIRRQTTLYALVAVGSLVANVAFMYVLVDTIGLWYLAAQVLVSLSVGGVSFLINKFFTFAPRLTS